ncbi:hypothetical protein A1Q1_04757 [Trichosporon asahii var. asahii CBS 2479]|uniref:Uncharacterized protein n=1 Tax=Trichosporon asahii var. asahii (strain ATCC 90039 / CBS 2479 / JCM 2466 / KCTC 7840 / NBRC 103889/ NCYC 2677 / UAMH 7654) TaxID=1186058 RepID=J4U845_TRIAS|nr:hypothetical protein A1Q1_04757 [Trichosporon asahii var. asahii CBS 2479]EJT46580.1 hypothetical protein A1Q1_04757 [Trichosporon asahii var. asahii CBS 2479]
MTSYQTNELFRTLTNALAEVAAIPDLHAEKKWILTIAAFAAKLIQDRDNFGEPRKTEPTSPRLLEPVKASPAELEGHFQQYNYHGNKVGWNNRVDDEARDIRRRFRGRAPLRLQEDTLITLPGKNYDYFQWPYQLPITWAGVRKGDQLLKLDQWRTNLAKHLPSAHRLDSVSPCRLEEFDASRFGTETFQTFEPQTPCPNMPPHDKGSKSSWTIPSRPLLSHIWAGSIFPAHCYHMRSADVSALRLLLEILGGVLRQLALNSPQFKIPTPAVAEESDMAALVVSCAYVVSEWKDQALSAPPSGASYLSSGLITSALRRWYQCWTSSPSSSDGLSSPAELPLCHVFDHLEEGICHHRARLEKQKQEEREAAARALHWNLANNAVVASRNVSRSATQETPPHEAKAAAYLALFGNDIFGVDSSSLPKIAQIISTALIAKLPSEDKELAIVGALEMIHRTGMYAERVRAMPAITAAIRPWDWRSAYLV